MELTATTLPGISFNVVTPKPRPLLPRMDIAGFVGFAATGPLHTPVAIESPEQFRDVFGPDLRLAWDQTAGRYLTSHLGQTVSAFFRGGGRRCWVVRVGRQQEPTRFGLPHLFSADTLTGATIAARCQGSWADDLRVGTRLKPTVLRLENISPVPGKPDLFRFTTIGAKIFPGDLIRVPIAENPNQYLFLQVGQTDGGQHQVSASAAARWVGWDSAAAAWKLLPIQPIPGASRPAERLLFDIWVWQAEQLLATLLDVGFLAAHPRFWGKLASDEALFAIEDIFSQERQWNAFEKEILSPRFPLAAPGLEEAAFLPLGMPTTVRSDLAVPAAAAIRAVDPLQRDGLDDFEADLFLEQQLAPFSSRTLAAEADQRFYLEKSSRYAAGIHALLPLEEVTLLAAPDAVHPGWVKNTPVPEPVLSPPVLQPPGPGEGCLLQWSVQEPALQTNFDLEWADEPTFAAPSKQDVHFSDRMEIYQIEVRLTADCPRRWYARVRERRGGLLSPFSNTATFIFPPDVFERCFEHRLAEPVLVRVGDSPQAENVQLTASASRSLAEAEGASPPEGWPEAVDFEIETAGTPDFYNASVSYASGLRIEAPSRWEAALEAATPDHITYFRVRLITGTVKSAWSNTVIIRPPPVAVWETDSFSDGTAAIDQLTAVHRAMLHLCRARKDMVALLSLPHGLSVQEALSYPDRLTNLDSASPTIVPVIPAGSAALSCAALYHPWLVMGDNQPRPPDGAAAGLIATTVLERGAWIAPANRPLPDAVALSPELTPAEENDLYRRQINPVRQTPRGFLVLSAETLSTDPALKPLNVRRLLMLLCRQALREGQTFVFEPLSPTFRRLVQHRYERLLTFLYERGAFAGATPAEAFQVITDERANTRQSLDAGRFYIELRVAPAQPLAFITIKLVQTEQAGLTLTEG